MYKYSMHEIIYDEKAEELEGNYKEHMELILADIKPHFANI